MTETATRDMLKAALSHTRRGWPVFPVWPIRNGACACGDPNCERPGKHPIGRLVPNGKDDATIDEATIAGWLATVPDANIATTAHLRIDADTTDDGVENWRDLYREHGGLPDTPICLTPSGGSHTYFKPPEGWEHSNGKGALPPGIDVRGHGAGYTLLPPSNHLQGVYTWEYPPGEVGVAPLPDWLAEILGRRKKRAEPVGDTIPAGARNETLTSLAGSMRRRGMDAAEIEAALHAVNKNRCEPPLPDNEVASIAKSVTRYEPTAPISANGQGPATVTDDEPAKGWTVALAEHICKSEHFAMSEGGELHYYDGGRYVSNGKRHIRRRVKRTLVAWGREDVFTSYRANEVTAYIAADAPLLWTQPPAGRLNVANGILDLHTRTLQEHTPKWLSTLQLPVTYDPAAAPDQWERFIGDWFPADAQETPWELLAWLISPSLSLQKAGLLLGNGANGKSRFLAAVKAFLGARNVAALSLAQIEMSRWATHHLAGKLANICPDLPAQHLETSSMFKALTGGDTVPAEKKHGDMYEYRPFARLLFSANQPPQSKDASRAFFRRWIVIPFDATFAPEERLPEAEIDELLSAPEQLSGALNRALDALPTVQRDGITETESMREAHREFHEVTDPIEVWLETNTVEQPGAYVVKGDLAKAYNEAAREKGWPVLTASQFGRRVKEWRPNLEDGQKRVADSRPTVWYGLGLKVDDTR